MKKYHIIKAMPAFAPTLVLPDRLLIDLIMSLSGRQR